MNESLLRSQSIRIKAACLTKYLNSKITFTDFKAFSEWVDGYQYSHPAARVINSDLIKYLLDSGITFSQLRTLSYVIELYSTEVQEQALRNLLCPPNSQQLTLEF